NPPRSGEGAACLLPRPGVEPQGGGVDAVAQPGRRRAVVEDVPQVGVAAAAGHLGPPHQPGVVLVRLDDAVGGRLPEAGPTGPGGDLGGGVEQRLPAADAAVDAGLLGRPVRAGEGALRALLPGDVVLLGGELPAPLLVRLGYLLAHGGVTPQYGDAR